MFRFTCLNPNIRFFYGEKLHNLCFFSINGKDFTKMGSYILADNGCHSPIYNPSYEPRTYL